MFPAIRSVFLEDRGVRRERANVKVKSVRQAVNEAKAGLDFIYFILLMCMNVARLHMLLQHVSPLALR